MGIFLHAIAGFPEVVLEDRALSFRTIIQDHGRILNEEKAEPFDYGSLSQIMATASFVHIFFDILILPCKLDSQIEIMVCFFL